MLERIIDRKLIYYIITHYIDTRQLLKKLGLPVKANNSMYCPFHENQNTPSAHLYKEEDNSYRIWCYAEDKMFSNVDLYKTYLPDIDLEELANLIYARLPDNEKLKIKNNVNIQYELPELPYEKALNDFKNNKITYRTLLNTINMNMPKDDTVSLLNMIYNLGEENVNIKNTNKYVYYMKNYKSDYKFISAMKLLINFGNRLPQFLKEYLRISGDSIMLPNKINDTVYSITFRNINGQKQFIKIGQTSHLFYNLGNIPEDFTYGTPILITEGNMDCDAIKQIYPYTVASLTNSLSLNQIQLLKGLTNKIILAYDNDDAGNSGYWNVYNNLKAKGFSVKRFMHSQKLKDFGDLIDLQMKDIDEFNYILLSYKIQINNLLSSL